MLGTLKIIKIVYLTYFYYENVDLPGGNTTVLDCIEMKYNPIITPINPMVSNVIYWVILVEKISWNLPWNVWIYLVNKRLV